MIKVKPLWSELWIVYKIWWVINTKPADHIAREGSKGMIQPHYLSGSLQAFEASYNQFFAKLCHRGLEFCHATSRKIRVEWLSPLAVELMSRSRKMRSFEIDNTTDETLVSVRWTHGGRDVQFIVIVVVANGKLVRINSYNRSYIVCKS